MSKTTSSPPLAAHSHVFLGAGHARNEHKIWTVIWLCGIMMLAEIIGGKLFGSLALIADGMHMSTHAGALLIAALAYTYSRRHAQDPRFVFGTGKLGDLAGFTSAIILLMIALLIGYEAIIRLLSPVKIDFSVAIPIAAVGLAVNLISAWLLSGGDHAEHSHHHGPASGHDDTEYALFFAEHEHEHSAHATKAHHDNNMRAAYMHVFADAAVSVLVITGLTLARYFGWVWMDPAAGILGALVIANWSYGLMRDTGGILLDMNPDKQLAEQVRKTIETDGDRLVDLHLWRLGPGHLGAIVSVITGKSRDPAFYRARLDHFKSLSHVTIEVQPEIAAI
jgi:cation diffusion facilitator family transporter